MTCKLRTIVIVSVACLWLMIRECECHGRLLDPVSRASLWRVRSKAPKNEDDAALSCGGFDVLQRNKGRCGVCGDPFQVNQPRPHEFGGKFGKGGVVKTYKQGQKMTMNFEVVISHGGRVEFKVCAAPPSGEVTQGCLDSHPLPIIQGKKSSPSFSVKKTGKSRITVQLPKDLTCQRCVLQYSYIGADRKGTCSDGKQRDGCGPQALYRACADIAIRGNRRKRQTCYGVGLYSRVPGADAWCDSNCQIGFCPASHCECALSSEDNALD